MVAPEEEQPEVPTFPETQPNRRYFSATFRGQEYQVTRRGTYRQFQEWFTAYAPVAPICGTCERLIFPGPVGEGANEKGEDLFFHMRSDCAPSIAYSGTVEMEGSITPAFPEGDLVSHMIQTGEQTVVVGLLPRQGNPY